MARLQCERSVGSFCRLVCSQLSWQTGYPVKLFLGQKYKCCHYMLQTVISVNTRGSVFGMSACLVASLKPPNRFWWQLVESLGQRRLQFCSS